MHHLGLAIDTVAMKITYPLANRQYLLNIIDKDCDRSSTHTLKGIDILLVHACTANTIQPIGSYFSICIQ